MSVRKGALAYEIRQGDCVDVMAGIPEASVDAIVCDPPYGLEFMGKEWDRLDAGLPQEAVWKGRRGQGGSKIGTDDSKPASRHHVSLGAGKKHAFKRCLTCGKRQFSGSPCECREPEWSIEYPDGAPSSSLRMQRWHEQWAREALRVLKPGGHLLAFGGTRTYHRLAAGIEDAGFEIRDCVLWLYGTGFPKSLDVSKAIDKGSGHWRGRAGAVQAENGSMAGANYERTPKGDPVTAAAAAAAGWGTALKPACEPVVVARKPTGGTVAAAFTEHGTGALNIDACRIGSDPTLRERTAGDLGLINDDGWTPTPGTNGSEAGRWPANVVLDEAAAALLDEQSGELVSGANPTRRGSDKFRAAHRGTDVGGASRFFYVAKPDAYERQAGLGGEVSLFAPADAPDRNDHPTVKPIALMRWLCRLVTPPGGLVLDPFTGSGTTGCAAALEGFRFVGIEREPEYVLIARARLAHWALETAA